MLKVNITVSPNSPGSCEYYFVTDEVSVFVHRRGAEANADELNALRGFGERVVKEMASRGCTCDLSAIEDKNLWRFVAKIQSVNFSPEVCIIYSELADGIVSVQEALGVLNSVKDKALSMLDKAKSSCGKVEPPPQPAIEPDLFPHAAKCFNYLRDLGLKDEDAAKVISICAERILETKVPLTDEDYALIYKDLTSEIGWQPIAPLVNLLYEKAGKPVPQTDAEFSAGVRALKAAIYRTFPQFKLQPSMMTLWSKALFYFIWLKIQEGEIKLQ